MLLSAAAGRPSIADVLPNCLASLEGRPGTLELPPVRSAIVLLVDGLGASMLRSRAGHARHLVREWPKRHTAHSFPSTTVAGITSLTTGSPAGAHGLIGYSVFDRAHGLVRNQLSGWGEAMDTATWQLRPTLFEQLADGPIEPVVVGMPAYATSGLTAASLRGARYVSAESLEDRVDAALDEVQRERRLVYLYVAELDQAGHRSGWESDDWLARLEELDGAVAALEAGLPDDVGLLITADHGMVDVPRHRQLDLAPESPLLEGVVAVAGEPRLRHLMLDDVASNDPQERAATGLVERWRDSEGARMVAATRREAIEAGWYGRPEDVSALAAARIGDVVIAATKLVTYYGDWMQGGPRGVIGQHGSITPEETIVPLIRRGAFALA